MTQDLQALLLGGTAFPFHDIEELGPHIEAALSAEGIDAEITTDREELAVLPDSEYDVCIDYTTDSEMTDAQLSGLLEFVERGGGYAGVHGAAALETTVPSDPDDVVGEREEPNPELEELIGGRFIRHPDPAAFDVRIVDSHHPITINRADFQAYDEPYEVVTDDVHVLARMDHPDLGDMPVAWVKPYGDGRSFYTALGHFRSAFEGEARALLGAGVRWAGGRA
ncbi:ThuA domain-containing protein [Halorhabdus tiamatea]|uniref:ThuA-like glycosyl hydrolase, possibly involved in trehalose utilization n=2 Tax=Halorhabdus tiamatea SARL4B TaxID=1033806 RepID=F7PPC9_9EURY|nr:ThuA domain-containing protein [Halorhabdus tiamatea]CCQ32846.1 ThuA-like glycosyl hydrolase, possibly involved in trehalose utilization [Halorhabdus tiamatea SARL4B]